MGKNYRISVEEVPDIGGSGESNAPIQYTLTGPDLDELSRITTKIVDEAKKSPAPSTSTALARRRQARAPGLDRSRPRGGNLGISVADIASTPAR